MNDDMRKCQYCVRTVPVEMGRIETKRYRHGSRIMTSTRFCCHICAENKRIKNEEIKARKQNESLCG